MSVLAADNPPPALVRFESSIAAEIFYDGKSQGTVSPDKPLLVQSIAPGLRAFTIKRKGQAEESRTVLLEADKTVTVYIIPLATLHDTSYSTLKIHGNLSGDVFLGDTNLGTLGPGMVLSSKTITPGRQILRFMPSDGAAAQERTLFIGSNLDITLELDVFLAGALSPAVDPAVQTEVAIETRTDLPPRGTPGEYFLALDLDSKGFGYLGVYISPLGYFRDMNGAPNIGLEAFIPFNDTGYMRYKLSYQDREYITSALNNEKATRTEIEMAIGFNSTLDNNLAWNLGFGLSMGDIMRQAIDAPSFQEYHSMFASAPDWVVLPSTALGFEVGMTWKLYRNVVLAPQVKAMATIVPSDNFSNGFDPWKLLVITGGLSAGISLGDSAVPGDDQIYLAMEKDASVTKIIDHIGFIAPTRILFFTWLPENTDNINWANGIQIHLPLGDWYVRAMFINMQSYSGEKYDDMMVLIGSEYNLIRGLELGGGYAWSLGSNNEVIFGLNAVLGLASRTTDINGFDDGFKYGPSSGPIGAYVSLGYSTKLASSLAFNTTAHLGIQTPIAYVATRLDFSLGYAF